MLLLVLAYRYIVCLIQQDVCGHQNRICEQTCVDVVLVLCRLVLELGHAGKLAEHRVAVEDPCKLGVCRNVRLHEKYVLLRIKTAGNVLCQLVE